jgi:hypothetical protein
MRKSLLRKPFLASQILLRTIFAWPVEVVLMVRLALFARRIFPEATTMAARLAPGA